MEWVNEFGIILSNFDPNQPRIPSGSPEGGEWTTLQGKGGMHQIQVAPAGHIVGGKVPYGFIGKHPSEVMQQAADIVPHHIKEQSKTIKPTRLKDLASIEPDYTKITDPKVRKQVEDGVKGYYDGDFQAMNGTLRQKRHVGGMFNSDPEDVKNKIDGFKRAFDTVGHKLTSTTVVYRKTDKNLPFDVTKVGTVFQDDGFVSTTTDEKTMTVQPGQIKYNITVPQGTTVVAGMGGRDASKEVTLNSGTKFKVVSVKNGGRVINIEVVQ